MSRRSNRSKGENLHLSRTGVRAGGLKPSRARRKGRRAASADRALSCGSTPLRSGGSDSPPGCHSLPPLLALSAPKGKKNHLFRDDFQPGDSLRLGLTGPTGLFLAARRRFGQAALTAHRAVIHYRLFSPYRPPKVKKNHLFRDDFQPGDSLRLGLTGPTGLFLAARRRFGQAALTARRAVIHYRLFSPYRPPKGKKKIISFEMTSNRATNSGLAWWGR